MLEFYSDEEDNFSSPRAYWNDFENQLEKEDFEDERFRSRMFELDLDRALTQGHSLQTVA
jgi:hypothetical protein